MWARPEPLLPSGQGGRGCPDGTCLNPLDLGTLFFTRFNRWNRSSVWRRVLEALRGEADCEWVMVDGTVIRAHQYAAGAKGEPAPRLAGRSRGGFSTKVHLIGDAHGNPVNFVLTPGHSQERKHLGSLFLGQEAGAALGDRAYDGSPCRVQVTAIGAEAVVPPHPCRKDPVAFDRHLYKARQAIKNLFAKPKQYRSLATRCDKTMRSSSAMAAVACALAWL